MFRHILVGLDGSESAQQALKQALRWAAQSGAEVWALSVEERLPAYAAMVGEVQATKSEREAYFQKVQQAATTEAKAMNVRFHSRIVAGRAAEVLVRYARDGGFDLVVLGGSNRGIGGTADKVVEQAPCSVTVVREPHFSVVVEDIMTAPAVTVDPASPTHEVVGLMIKRGVKAVPVIDADRHVAGIITGGDLLERGGLGHRLSLLRNLDSHSVAAKLHELAQRQQAAQEIMTPEPLSISWRTPLSAVARLMVERRFKRLPVLDDDERLIGIVARLDVLRAIAHTLPIGEAAASPVVGGRLVREFMSASVPTVTSDTEAIDIVTRLAASACRRVVVLDAQRRVLGIITDLEVIKHFGPQCRAGLLSQLARRTEPPDEIKLVGRAAAIMRRDVVTVAAEAPIAEALRLMLENRFKRLPVINGGGRLAGIVDHDAVLRAVAGEL